MQISAMKGEKSMVRKIEIVEWAQVCTKKLRYWDSQRRRHLKRDQRRCGGEASDYFREEHS